MKVFTSHSCWNKKLLSSFCFLTLVGIRSSYSITMRYDVQQCNTNSGTYYLGIPPPADANLLVVSARSSFACAVLAKLNQAIGYAFEGGNCILIEPTKGDDCNSIFFGRVDFPPLDKLVDVSRGKDVQGSPVLSDLERFFPASAIDDDMNTFYHSTWMSEPWLIIDIGSQRLIHQVQILPRLNCCPERFNNIEIRVGDSLKTDGSLSSYTLMSTYDIIYTPHGGYLLFSSGEGFFGRFLSIQKMASSTSLEIADVKIYVAI